MLKGDACSKPPITIKSHNLHACDACSRPPITTRSHDLHACDIKGVVGVIASYYKRD